MRAGYHFSQVLTCSPGPALFNQRYSNYTGLTFQWGRGFMLAEGVESSWVTTKVSGMALYVYVHISCVFTCMFLCFISVTLEYQIADTVKYNVHKMTITFVNINVLFSCLSDFLSSLMRVASNSQIKLTRRQYDRFKEQANRNRGAHCFSG